MVVLILNWEINLFQVLKEIILKSRVGNRVLLLIYLLLRTRVTAPILYLLIYMCLKFQKNRLRLTGAKHASPLRIRIYYR